MVDKNLTPEVNELDLDAFVSGQTKSTKTPSTTKSTKTTKQTKPLAKSKDPDYHKLTLYLPKELIAQLKTCVASETGKDVSDISAELYSTYVSKTMKRMLKQFD